MKDIVYKTINNYEEISTAYHEAGHVIYALLCFSKVEKVKVISHNEAYVYYNVPEYWATNNKQKQLALIKKEISIRYAGVLSEKIFYENLHGNQNLPISIRIGSSIDFKDVSKLLNKYKIKTPGKERSKFKNKIKNKVQKELKSNWNSIALIANCLLKYKELNYNKIKSLLSKVSKKWISIFKKIDS